MSPYLSPLRYPGSKRRLIGYIDQALTLNQLRPKLYIEPFVGGGNIALHLLLYDRVEKAVLIDIDPYIANFWKAVFFDTDWLVEQIDTIEVSLEKWREFKAAKPKTSREFALTCLFLNRTNFSGILRDEVGPLGGREQKSKYKIDCRFPRNTLINRIEQISKHKEKIVGIWSCSWEAGIQEIRGLQQSNELPKEELFFYLDPPFFERGEELYRHYFQEKDHIKLRDFLVGLEDAWILSYDSTPQVESLYENAIRNGTNGTKKHNVELIYSTGIMVGRKPTEEIIISNLRQLPKESKFWKVASGLEEK